MDAAGNRDGLDLAAERVPFFPREPHTAAPSFLRGAAIDLLSISWPGRFEVLEDRPEAAGSGPEEVRWASSVP